MPDPEDAIERIMDRYDYYGFLQLVFGYDFLAQEITELADIDDVDMENTE